MASARVINSFLIHKKRLTVRITHLNRRHYRFFTNMIKCHKHFFASSRHRLNIHLAHSSADTHLHRCAVVNYHLQQFAPTITKNRFQVVIIAGQAEPANVFYFCMDSIHVWASTFAHLRLGRGNGMGFLLQEFGC
uniref:(northern house mosquito) hypothetical protein n=2 Tax=Culex pipiens TaxID=7175 RepID=A0A8D8DCE5_CULPI